MKLLRTAPFSLLSPACRAGGSFRISDFGFRPSPARRRAFSLVEVMVVVTLLTFIILGLTVMFNETQRAFRTGLTQTDVLEAGRVVSDMLARELEQAYPSRLPYVTNFSVVRRINKVYTQTYSDPDTPPELRTNVLQDLFFLRKENTTWTATGYFVLDQGGAGTLYRFSSEAGSLSSAADIYNLADSFKNWAFAVRANPQIITNRIFQPIIDGVVHFRTRAYDTNGVLITEVASPPAANAVLDLLAPDSNTYFYDFTSNAVPAYVELELGILERRTLERLRSIPDQTARANYLRNEALGNVHLFRQRITVRNVDPAAYQ